MLRSLPDLGSHKAWSDISFSLCKELCVDCCICGLGVKKDGTPKIRPIDHMTESLVNASTQMSEKLTTDTLDVFFETARMLRELCQVYVYRNTVCIIHEFAFLKEPLAIVKADVDSAYRRIPLLPAHRKYATIAFKVDGMPMLFQHNAMCFGAVASVWQWNRIGEW